MNAELHAAMQAQQRGIPPLVEKWLDEVGEERPDRYRGVVKFFSRVSVRPMERASGRAPKRKLAEYFNV